MSAEGPLYLGFDLSTQQLKADEPAIIVQSDLTVVAEVKVDFDADFGAKYKLNKGVLTNDAEHEVFAPVALFLEALDLVLDRLREKIPDGVSRVKGISGSCQQHGSTYWSSKAESLLANLGPSKALVDQLTDAFSHPYAPNWQDGSTQAQCDRFDEHLGDPQRLAEVTGSAAHHRFTGTQIMRLREKLPDMYAATDRISLISSFLASLLLGRIAPLDISDVTGMNLWDIPSATWSDELLSLAAGGDDKAPALRKKLGEPEHDGGASLGTIAPYFQRRHGFAADCHVTPFTGDNPATILALPLRPMDAIVSLGTSSTFLMITPIYKPDASYHFMNHPTTPGQYMFMLCYKNGGLAREQVRDRLGKDDKDPWAAFNKAVTSTPVLGASSETDDRKIGLYFPRPEIVPNIRAGTYRHTLSPKGELSEAKEEWTAETDARVIVESQALSMRLRSRNLVHSPREGLPAQPRRIYLVGGGSLNPAIGQVLGEVLGGAEGVYRLDVGGNACALGGAYKAVWARERKENETFDELIGARWKEDEAVERVDVGYREGVFEKYGEVVDPFEEMEKRILKVAKN